MRKEQGKGSTPTEISEWQSHCSVGEAGILSTQFLWHFHTMKCKGQWIAETSKGCRKQVTHNNLLHWVSGFVSNIQMQVVCSLLFPLSGKKWLRDTSFTSSFLGHFHFIKLQSVSSYVCWGGMKQTWWSHHWLLKRPQNKPLVRGRM